MTSLGAAARLQNARNLVRSAKESNSSASVESRITTFCTDIHEDQFYSLAGYDVTRYFRSSFIEVERTAENAASDGFGSHLSGTAFCLDQPTGGFLG